MNMFIRMLRTSFIILVILLLGQGISSATNFINKTKLISDVDNTLIDDYVINSDVTVTTESVEQRNNNGFANLLITGIGDLDVSIETSIDGTNWYTPYTTDGTTLTAAGTIVDSWLTDKWIILTSRMADYVKFKFLSN